MNKIRVGILLNSFSVQVWQQALLKRVLALDFVTVAILVMNTAPARPRSPKNFLYHLYVDEERKRAKLPRDMYEMADISPLLSSFPKIDVLPNQRGPLDYFSDDDVARVESYNLDVIIRLGFRILQGKILTAASCGIWSYHHCDNELIRGNPPGFYEVVHGHQTTGCLLQILKPELDDGTILHRSWSLTHPTSVARNRAQNFWKSVGFVPMKLRELSRLGKEEFMRRAEYANRHPTVYSRPLYRNPTNIEMIRYLPRLLWLHLWPKLRKHIVREQWCLMYTFSSQRSLSPRRFRKLVPPRDRFWADPFVISREGTHYVYFEDADLQTGFGRISMIELSQDGRYSAPRTILDKPYHLSYPYVFEREGAYYMIPETEHNRTVELYECVSFPDKWEFRMNLMEDVRAVDVTPLFHDGLWWLFMNMVEEDGASLNDELFIFYGPELFSKDWTPHQQNPVLSDIRRSRPAGPIFCRDGELYRPSQNPAGFNINRIVKLSKEEYQEEVCTVVKPSWDRNCRRTHSFVQGENITIIDTWMRRFRHF